MTTQHRLKYETTNNYEDLPRKVSERVLQGALMFILTTTQLVELATDATTNLKFAGLAVGWDRQPNVHDKVRLEIGGCKVWMPVVLTQTGTGGTVTISGTQGTLDSIIADGEEILHTPVAFDSSLTITAATAARQINRNNTRFFATSSGAAITIRQRVVVKEAFTVVSDTTTLGSTDVNASAGKAFVDANLGADVFPSTAYVVKFSGTAKVGTFDSFRDEDGNQMEPIAGAGSITVVGGSGTLSSLTVGGTELLASSVNFTTSAEVTAGLIRDAINLNVGTSKYFAEAVGATVHIHQTQDAITEDTQAIVAAGSLGMRVNQDVTGGSLPYARIKLRAKGAVLT